MSVCTHTRAAVDTLMGSGGSTLGSCLEAGSVNLNIHSILVLDMIGQPVMVDHVVQIAVWQNGVNGCKQVAVCLQ